MPIYEFICRSCKTDFEKLVPASMRDAVECPDCGSGKTARKISLSAPVQVKVGSTKASSSFEGCGAANCCGGACNFAD